MENNAAIKEMVKMINEESIFIRKPFGMYAGFSFHISYVTFDMVYITVKAQQNQEHHENYICSYINAMVNFLQDILPVAQCEVTYYSKKEDFYPEFIRIYPFYKHGEELKTNVIFIEENVIPIREKIRERFGSLFPKTQTGPNNEN